MVVPGTVPGTGDLVRVRTLIISSARIIMIAVSALAGAVVLLALLINVGEVVVLETTDELARQHETQLWVVELEGTPYLRAGNPGVAWLARLRAHPLVELKRDGEFRRYRALPHEVEPVRERLAASMRAKYGLADRLIGSILDRSRAVPIRLVPAPHAPTGNSPREPGGGTGTLEDGPRS